MSPGRPASGSVLVFAPPELGVNRATELCARLDFVVDDKPKKDEPAQVLTGSMPAKMIALPARGQVVVQIARTALIMWSSSHAPREYSPVVFP